MDRRVVVWCATTAPATLLALRLLGCAVTLVGRVSAACALMLVALPPLAWTRRRRAARSVIAALVVGGTARVVLAPSGLAPPGARVRAVYLRGGEAARLAPTNLVPEGDLLVLATYMVWIPDSRMTLASAARLRGAIRSVYASVERDAAFRALGSALGDALTDRDTGRLYVYEPPHAPGERRPALVFLHGSAGSWKGYFHGQVALARRRRMAVAQPSFGFGAWDAPGGLAAIERTRSWLVAQPWVDPSRVYLACLSNGGRGVARHITYFS